MWVWGECLSAADVRKRQLADVVSNLGAQVWPLGPSGPGIFPAPVRSQTACCVHQIWPCPLETINGSLSVALKARSIA